MDFQKWFRRGRESWRQSKFKMKKARWLQRNKTDSDVLTEGIDDLKVDARNIREHHETPLRNGAENNACFDVSPTININDGAYKKVKFRKGLSSPEQNLDGADDDTLFDDSMLSAFKAGQLSIADFLKPTPETTRKSRSLSESAVEPSQLPLPPKKKLSLLDRAHSMASRNIDTRVLTTPVLRKQLATDCGDDVELKTRQVYDSSSSQNHKLSVTSLSNDESPTHKTLEGLQSDTIQSSSGTMRFSKSLEDLAQEVFGNEFQSYLENASKSPVKVPLSSCKSYPLQTGSTTPKKGVVKQSITSSTKWLQQRISDYDARRKSLSPRSKLMPQSSKTFSRSEPVGRKLRDLCSVQIQQDQTHLQSSFRDESNDLLRLVDKNKVVHSIGIPMQSSSDALETNEESWSNTLDRSSGSSLAGNDENALIFSIDKENILFLPTTCDVIEQSGNVPGLELSLKAQTCQYGKYSHSPTLTDSRKISQTDSQSAHAGSLCADLKSTGSETSFLEIQFPPPPPVDYPIEFDMRLSASQLSTEDLNVCSQHDPLVESLMSIVPLPRDPELLISHLTKSFSELVSEIIASRQKINAVMESIEVHQQIMKEHIKLIQTQAQDIAQLRKTVYVLRNVQNLPADDDSGVVRLNLDAKKRRPHSAGIHRQSREMVVLNNALDMLLRQCVSLQNTPRDLPRDRMKTNLIVLKRSEENVHNSVENNIFLRRSNSFPTRRVLSNKDF